jgi:hypothetical protein
MAAPTTFLLACCLFIGGLCYMQDRAAVSKPAPCAISKIPTTPLTGAADQVFTRSIAAPGLNPKVHGDPNSRRLPAHALQSLRQAETCPKT